MSPTQRTLKHLRDAGYTVAVVERWNQYAKIRQDLFGIIDLIAISPIAGIVGIQACAGASHAARRAKSIAEPRLRTWLQAGGKFEVFSWSKTGARGKRKTWTPRCESIRYEDLDK